jgi:hypothetical protein
VPARAINAKHALFMAALNNFMPGEIDAMPVIYKETKLEIATEAERSWASALLSWCRVLLRHRLHLGRAGTLFRRRFSRASEVAGSRSTSVLNKHKSKEL